jgi:hypothetical protein
LAGALVFLFCLVESLSLLDHRFVLHKSLRQEQRNNDTARQACRAKREAMAKLRKSFKYSNEK